MTDSTIYFAAHSYSSSRQSSNDVVVGLDDDLLAVKENIWGASPNLQVIPIVGTGGIGKTTLAITIYQDRLIRESFDISGWVTVSQSYSVDETLTTLQESLNPLEESHDYPEKLFELNADSKEDMVYKTLKGKKYLIVMDDVRDTQVWDHLRWLLPDDKNGSRIILTTRLVDVATYTKGCSPHEMQLMHEDQSWNLLRQKVFTGGVCNCELEDIGMAIARSCEGLPLAIVVIAGLLSTVDRIRDSWEEIKEKVNSTVSAKHGQFENILSLSYKELPRHLRQCLVYMGGFQKDHDVHVGELIKLWIAEGFIGAISSSKSLEEEAEEYLQDLIKRSLVMVGTRKPHGEIKSCSLHDMMRDLCVRKADEEKFPLHDAYVNGTLLAKLEAGILEDVEYLRVMDVGKDVLDPSPAGPELYMWIPEQIFRVSNLRYLVLAYCVEIPNAISNLENLQTLIIYTMEGLVRLPVEIWNMPQLRHLVSSLDQLPCPEGEAISFRLENLQTLSKVCNLECTDRLVESIPNIKKLGLLYSASYEFQQGYHVDDLFSLHQLESLVNPARDYDYHLENLERLQQLEKLKVQVYAGFQGKFNPIFPLSLKKLSLSGWRLPSWSHLTIVGSLPNLQVLKLRDFRGQDSVWETREGGFPRLSFLLIERSDLLKWITGPEHFPTLKQLLIHYCYYLDEIPASIGDIPTLELVEVREGSNFLAESAKRIEKKLKDDGSNSFRVHHPTDYAAAGSYSSSRLETASSNVVVGIDDDLLAIKEQLFGESTKLQVIPIVGMGGIGKTTLARSAYHDPLVRESFGIGGWVTVSQSYSLEGIFSALLQSLKPFDTKPFKKSHKSRPDASEHENDEYAAEGSEEGAAKRCISSAKVFEQSPNSTGDQVYKTLKGRKYLVVIDDIWNIQVWHQLKRLLPDDKNRSRIILTTRLMDVATYAENRRPHEMQLMHEDQSWDLLRQKVFTKGAYNHELEAIGMKIARSCGGLPLAIVVIAGLLSTVDRTLASWEEIAEKLSSTVAAKDGQFDKILSLSYTELPRHLRQCFVYMGGFPEDREIPIAKLIKLWIAEGFIESTNASTTTSLENEAEECLQDLIKRSLVLVGTRKPHGEIKSCSLHDLMRELCIRKANEDKFTLHDVDVDGTLVERLKKAVWKMLG